MIGDRIRELRTAKGLSITSLAERAGVAKSYVSQIERGINRNPSMEFISKISAVLEIDMLDLIAEKEFSISQDWMELIREVVEMGITKEQFEAIVSIVLSLKH